MSESGKWMILGGVVLFGVMVYLLSPILTPFLIAIVLAYLMDPLVNRLQHWKLPRTLAVVCVFLLLILLILVALLFLIPMLERQIVIVINKIPDMVAWVQNTALPWLSQRFDIPLNFNFNLDFIKKTLSSHWQGAGGAASAVMSTVTQSGLAIVAFATNLVLVPVVMFYLLRDWDGVIVGVHDLLPRRIEPVVSRLLSQCDEVISAFLRGQLMVMLGLGILYALGLWIVGLDLALLIGIIGGLLSIVPYLGLIIGVAVASIAALIQFQDFWHVLYVWIVFALAQSAESMVMTPLFVGDKIGLHPVAVIFAILAGGQLFGFVGILLALPVAAVIMVFLRYFREQYVASGLYAKMHRDEPGQEEPS